MAYTRQEQTQMPWWLQAVRHLQDNDGYNLPQQTPRMHVPASPVHSASDDEIDLTHTDNESGRTLDSKGFVCPNLDLPAEFY